MTPTAAQLGQWFDAYAACLVLYARQWVPHTAEDVVQEVFLKLAAQSPPRDAKAWLFRSVRNAAISQQRSDRRRRTREKHSAAGDWFEHRPEDLIDAATAQQVLASLPAEHREIVLLRIWGGLTLAEAGEVTGESISTLHSRYNAALSAVRTQLESSGNRRKSR